MKAMLIAMVLGNVDPMSCAGDAMKFCNKELSQGEKATAACMYRHRAHVTPACRAVLKANDFTKHPRPGRVVTP